MKTFEALNDAYRNREWTLPGIKITAQLGPLRDDPRSKELRRRYGFSN